MGHGFEEAGAIIGIARIEGFAEADVDGVEGDDDEKNGKKAFVFSLQEPEPDEENETDESTSDDGCLVKP